MVYFVFFMLLHNFSFEGERSSLVLHFFTVASRPKRPDSNNTKDVVQIHVFLSVVTKTLRVAGGSRSFLQALSPDFHNTFQQVCADHWLNVRGPSAPAEVSRLIIRLIKSPDSIETGAVMDLTVAPSAVLIYRVLLCESLCFADSLLIPPGHPSRKRGDNYYLNR